MISQSTQHSELSVDATRHPVREILSGLDRQWEPGSWEAGRKPVDELVCTILSQNTSDINTARAFESLQSAFPTWADVMKADVQEIVSAIRAGGLARQKAPRIQQVLAEVIDPEDDDPNATLLRKLDSMESAAAMTWLTSLNGVGPKTAACVLLFAVGKSVVPVDTHVHRVSKRIGLIGPHVSAERAHQDILKIVPDGDAYRFHVHLIHHGRTVCKARRPRCQECVIREYCDYAKALETTQAADNREAAGNT